MAYVSKNLATHVSKLSAAPCGNEVPLVLVATAPAAAPGAGDGGGVGLAREDRTHEHLGHFGRLTELNTQLFGSHPMRGWTDGEGDALLLLLRSVS